MKYYLLIFAFSVSLLLKAQQPLDSLNKLLGSAFAQSLDTATLCFEAELERSFDYNGENFDSSCRAFLWFYMRNPCKSLEVEEVFQHAFMPNWIKSGLFQDVMVYEGQQDTAVSDGLVFYTPGARVFSRNPNSICYSSMLNSVDEPELKNLLSVVVSDVRWPRKFLALSIIQSDWDPSHVEILKRFIVVEFFLPYLVCTSDYSPAIIGIPSK